jgi:outer membrane protein assembly factor BamB
LGIGQVSSLPAEWSDMKNLVWKTELPGAGTSSPVVVENRVFLTYQTGYAVDPNNPGDINDLKRHVLCIDAESGKCLWKWDAETVLPEIDTRRFRSYASSTPVVDDEAVYCFLGKSGVVALDHSGKLLWKASVGKETHGWGSASSPILYQNLVIVNAFVECGQLVALDKRTGKEVWRAGELKESWNTPLLVSLADGKTELVVAISGKILAFDPATGEELWSCDGHRWYIVPSLVTHKGIVYCLSGKGVEAAKAVRAGGRGDVTDTHVLWTTKKGSNVSSPVYHQGHLYFAHEVTGVAYCLNAATGDVVYETRLPRAGGVYASPVIGGDKLYYLSRWGGTLVLAAKPEYELLAQNQLEDQRNVNSSPAISNNRLFLRMNRYLYCIGEN